MFLRQANAFRVPLAPTEDVAVRLGEEDSESLPVGRRAVRQTRD
jgi:hypothetical protein